MWDITKIHNCYDNTGISTLFQNRATDPLIHLRYITINIQNVWYNGHKCYILAQNQCVVNMLQIPIEIDYSTNYEHNQHILFWDITTNIKFQKIHMFRMYKICKNDENIFSLWNILHTHIHAHTLAFMHVCMHAHTHTHTHTHKYIIIKLTNLSEINPDINEPTMSPNKKKEFAVDISHFLPQTRSYCNKHNNPIYGINKKLQFLKVKDV